MPLQKAAHQRPYLGGTRLQCETSGVQQVDFRFWQVNLDLANLLRTKDRMHGGPLPGLTDCVVDVVRHSQRDNARSLQGLIAEAAIIRSMKLEPGVPHERQVSGLDRRPLNDQ